MHAQARSAAGAPRVRSHEVAIDPGAGAAEFMTTQIRRPSALTDGERLRALDAASLVDTPVEDVFDRLTESGAAALGVPIALISLVTDDRQFFKSQCGLPGPVAEARETPLSHSLCQHVVHDREPLLIGDARLEPRVATNLAIGELGVIAYAGVPLVTAEGHVLGSFCAIDHEPREWSPRDVTILESLAAATMAVVGMRAEALASADIGRRLQAALVPEPPMLERADLEVAYRPGEQRLLVGGDFYVCSTLADGSAGVLIGDVTGHGPEAAAFAASLRAAWTALLLTPASLEEHMRRLNQVALDRQPSAEMFATALACTVAADRRSLQTCSAGHPSPVLIEAGEIHEAIVGVGPPLGVIGRGRWTHGVQPLAPQAAVLLYTDGLIEGRAARDSPQRLGIERVLAELHAQVQSGAHGAALLNAIVDFATRAHGAPLPDDVAALLLTLH